MDKGARQFKWDEEGRFLVADFAKLIGAAHAMELPFIFDSFDTFPVGGPKIFPPKREASRRELSDAMMSYWAEFAYSGDPDRGRNKGLPQWGAWAGRRGRSLVLDTPSDQGIRLTDESLIAEVIYRRLTDDKRLRSMEERCLISASCSGAVPRNSK